MCGRIVTYTPFSVIASRYFGCKIAIGDMIAKYNRPPGTQTLTVKASESEGYADTGYDFDLGLWGFLPPNALTGSKPLINARAETVASKHSFKDAFRFARCVVPVDGYYEWMATGQGKQPYYITKRDKVRGEVLFFAGLWASTGTGVSTCFTVITEPASPHIRHIHDRQPVILTPECVDKWLDRKVTERDEIRANVERLDPANLTHWPVSTRVNSVKNDDPELIKPID